jgi:preprotein translocase subunit SecG
MQILATLVLVVQVLCAIGVIVLVLLQHGKGADMGAAFGSGASGSLFGATGSANFLSRTTAVLATLFFVSTLALAYLSNNRTAAPSGSVMERMGTTPSDGIPGGPAKGAPAAPGAGGAPAAPATGGSVAPGAAPAAPAAGAAAAPEKGTASNEIPK